MLPEHRFLTRRLSTPYFLHADRRQQGVVPLHFPTGSQENVHPWLVQRIPPADDRLSVSSSCACHQAIPGCCSILPGRPSPAMLPKASLTETVSPIDAPVSPLSSPLFLSGNKLQLPTAHHCKQPLCGQPPVSAWLGPGWLAGGVDASQARLAASD
ncbi:hypothetical protein DPEC_G00115620 [Dallia pectoralis]|uniref:Uncharacterized protein n=1 Tax=Dallia pectoralis TaxID=75939 RepID=A0ACC2GUP0_DALPE|nr:hypothetical protein DPEC_G00115620 [Dallia pectoralis]